MRLPNQRAEGIEPPSRAWETLILPLNYARVSPPADSSVREGFCASPRRSIGSQTIRLRPTTRTRYQGPGSDERDFQLIAYARTILSRPSRTFAQLLRVSTTRFACRTIQP